MKLNDYEISLKLRKKDQKKQQNLALKVAKNPTIASKPAADLSTAVATQSPKDITPTAPFVMYFIYQGKRFYSAKIQLNKISLENNFFQVFTMINHEDI